MPYFVFAPGQVAICVFAHAHNASHHEFPFAYRPFRYAIGQHSDSDTFAQCFNLGPQCRDDNYDLSVMFGHGLRSQLARCVTYNNTPVSCDHPAIQRLWEIGEWVVWCNDEHVTERADWPGCDIGRMRRLAKCAHGQVGALGNQRVPYPPKHLGGKAQLGNHL